MFPILKRREPKRAVGWGDELLIRPDTPLNAAQKKQLAKAIKRAKRDGKIAATAQQTIPYEEMYENGVCRLGNRLYSKSIAFEDRSYAEASDDDKAVIFELYCRLVNYFGPTVGFQLSVVCYYPDMVEYRKILRIPPTGDSFDPIRKEFSDMLLSKAGLCKTERSLCLTFTVEAEDVKQATSRLEQIEADVLERFKGIGTQAHGMDGYERLLLLHHCLHLDEPQKFKFNWDSLVGTGLSSKDYIAPSSFLFKEGRYFRVGPSVGAVSFLQIQATKLYDTLLNALLNIESSQIVSIHAKALNQGAALKTVKRKLSDLDKAKIDEQKRAVRSGFDMDILPPDLVTFGKEAEKLLEDLQNHDEKMFMVTILLVHTAPTKQKLENIIYSVNGIANANNCNLIRLDYQQEQGFVSALPLGVNQVEVQRGLTTSGTAIFLPFRSCEVFQPGGLYYGVNAQDTLAALPAGERNILTLVMVRLLCAVSEKQVYEDTAVLLDCGGAAFFAKGRVVITPGWKSVEQAFLSTLKQKPEKDDPEPAALPSITEGQSLPGCKAAVREGTTSPPKHFTEDLLLSAMEHASAEDFAEIEGVERTGLGTPATRAGVIEKLVRGGFLERKGRQLLPTKKGHNLIEVLPDSIKSAKLTAEWEAALKEVERGERSADDFLSGIERMTADLVEGYRAIQADTSLFDQREPIGKCPRCGKDVVESKLSFQCIDRSCGFTMWKNSRFFTDKHKELTKAVASALLKKGRVKMTGLFSEKKGVAYDATVVLDDTGKYVNYKLEFDQKKAGAKHE